MKLEFLLARAQAKADDHIFQVALDFLQVDDLKDRQSASMIFWQAFSFQSLPLYK